MSITDSINNMIDSTIDAAEDQINKALEQKTLVPDSRIIVEGLDVTITVHKRLMSLTMVDNRGFDADTMTMQIDDSDSAVNLPRMGARVTIWLGFKSDGLRNFGEYIIDSVEHSGAPDSISIGGKSADFRKKFTEKKDKGHHDTTIGNAVEIIAKTYGWKPKINKDLAKIKITDKQQSDESDANFLTRIALDHDAIATVKDGNLLFIKMGECTTASGEPLPKIEIKRENGDQHRYSIADRDVYTGVKAKWNSAKNGKRKEVLVGDEEKVKSIKSTYKSEAEARSAAEAELKRLKRGAASFGFFLAKGNPYLTVESPVTVEGFKPEIDKIDWIATKVTHKLDNNGLTATVECEMKETQDKKK